MKTMNIVKKWKYFALLGFVLSLLMLSTGCSGIKSNQSDEESVDARTISYWIPKGEDSGFYNSYNENPITKYIEANYTFNGRALHIDYYAAPTGSAADNFTILLSTGENSDVMDLSMSPISAAEMYDEGVLQDLTELVPAHMPNYMAFFEANPELKENLYTLVDGEKKILTVYGFSDGISPNFEGFSYRRDWIAKYGVNPLTDEAFKYGFKDEKDYESWYDDVVFPSGTDEPIYISDWEWMFEIFDKAMVDMGITDGYGYAPYFQGYMQTGDFASAFGGGASCYWYRNRENQAVFGPTTEDFRAYLECLRTWFEKGWVDPAFGEHNSDIFYAVDPSKVYSGKVGLWQGQQSTIGTQIDADDAYTDGAVVFGCRQPINDIYGDEGSQNVEPYTFFQSTKLGSNVGITKKLSEDEVIAFLEYADFLFSEEGADLKLGLNKEQYETSKDAFYTEHGITNGSYTKDGDTYTLNVSESDPLYKALGLYRDRLGLGRVANVDHQFDRYVEQATSAWDYYTAVPSIFTVRNIPVEDGTTISKVRNNVDQFMIRSVTAIIMGLAYDITDDTQWEQFKKDMEKYQPEKATELYQKAIDLTTK